MGTTSTCDSNVANSQYENQYNLQKNSFSTTKKSLRLAANFKRQGISDVNDPHSGSPRVLTRDGVEKITYQRDRDNRKIGTEEPAYEETQVTE
jgi:hypothetical protein